MREGRLPIVVLAPTFEFFSVSLCAFSVNSAALFYSLKIVYFSRNWLAISGAIICTNAR